jgi:hypothetical protein
LNQDRDGRWNVIEALALREPDPKKSSEFAVNVRSLRLRDGTLALRFAGAGAKLYRLSALNLEGRMGFSPAGAQVEAREVMAGLVADCQPNLQLKGALAYDIPSLCHRCQARRFPHSKLP